MATKSNKSSKKITNKNYNLYKFIGNLLIIVSLILIYLIFYPVFKEELNYQINTKRSVTENKQIEPPNKDFSIVIPKIDAVAPVFKNVDPFNRNIFLPVLKKGVAHAKGSSLPGEGGNVYIFAHSTDSFYNVGNYNAVFYLLGKLKKGDEIDIYYKEVLYKYSVDEIKVVAATDTKYLKKLKDTETLTLQTCYPPGTTLKRLIVIANKI
ncbi:MAG: sortase [Candidatus Woesebacteria bacterium]|nr:sortase [Candidatus Woesebacteria bacterium]